MDGTTFTPTTTADDTNLHDLEVPIVKTKCAAQVLAIVLDEAAGQRKARQSGCNAAGRVFLTPTPHTPKGTDVRL